MTIRLSLCWTTSTAFRLCSRAPRNEIWVRLMGGVCSRFVLDAQEGVRCSETWDAGGRTARVRRRGGPFVEAMPPLATNVMSTHSAAAMPAYCPDGPGIEHGEERKSVVRGRRGSIRL